ncbi:MAG TPA: hypothetical protein PL045_13830, partial [Chitinophagaceae bacterium]|nr:hypothetical protein [Chitinophagaceae bacterium]
METQENFFAESRRNIEEYFQNYMLLLKLQAAEKISKLIAVITSGLLIATLGFFILFFLSILAAYYFTDVTGSKYMGFGIIAAFYLLVFILVLAFRKKVVGKYITNVVINI